MSSYLPIFSFTDDAGFGEITSRSKIFRFSMFRFSLGINKWYFLTYKNKEGFKIFRQLNLYELQRESTEKEIISKGNAYKELLESKTDDESELHIRALNHKNKQNENRFNKSLNKMLFYNAIGLFLLPLLIRVFSDAHLSLWTIIICFLLIYYLLNIYLFFFCFLKVSTYFRFPFKELKNQTTIKKFAIGLYKEWYAENKIGDLHVTYVKNVEKYLRASMIIIAIYILFLFGGKVDKIIGPAKRLITPAIEGKHSAIEKVIFDLSLSEKEVFNNDGLNKINEINQNLLSGGIKKIIVLRNGKDCSQEKYNKILELINLHNIKKIPIIEIDLSYNLDQKSNYIAIITLKDN